MYKRQGLYYSLFFSVIRFELTTQLTLSLKLYIYSIIFLFPLYFNNNITYHYSIYNYVLIVLHGTTYTFISVSYTHLDVHKRQVIKDGSYSTICGVVDPVSYTHLDVYKRQINMWYLLENAILNWLLCYSKEIKDITINY